MNSQLECLGTSHHRCEALLHAFVIGSHIMKDGYYYLNECIFNTT